MKNITNKHQAIVGTALLAFALFVAFAAFPGSASAQYNGGYGNYGGGATYHYNGVYSCPHPYVYPNGYYYCPVQATVPVQPPIVYQPPVYQQPIYQYPTLSASCYSVNGNGSVQAGTSVQWAATASGGYGSYTYSWSGTDGLYGSGSTAYMAYYNPGTKTASVTVYSGGQSITVNCGSSVMVYSQQYYYQQPPQTYVQPIVQPVYVGGNNNSGLDTGCFADPMNASINQPVTWSVEVTGGAAPYTYSWTGTDGLSGSSQSALMYYTSAGSKSAVVTVTSADGRTSTRACSNSITIHRRETGGNVEPVQVQPPVQQPVQQPQDNQQGSLGAAALFSLNNVPWGWVAILVILVLFCTVMYLLFNRPKI
jgi:hypothetical protein